MLFVILRSVGVNYDLPGPQPETRDSEPAPELDAAASQRETVGCSEWREAEDEAQAEVEAVAEAEAHESFRGLDTTHKTNLKLSQY